MINVFTKLTQQDKWEAAVGGVERGGLGGCRTETCGRDGWRWGLGSGGGYAGVGGVEGRQKRNGWGTSVHNKTNIVRSSLPCGRNLHELVILPHPDPPTTTTRLPQPPHMANKLGTRRPFGQRTQRWENQLRGLSGGRCFCSCRQDEWGVEGWRWEGERRREIRTSFIWWR